jgi:ABC-type sugar transport system ATPase subunit
MKNQTKPIVSDIENACQILSVSGISKIFPGVKALDTVSFDVNAGEVHALVGENGAGKSTLMKILAGNYHLDGGEIFFQGKEIAPKSPLESKELGILLIHQELSLVPELTVAENIYMGSYPADFLRQVNYNELHRNTKRVLEQLGCPFKPGDRVKNLSIANQQMVEIGRALAFNSDLVIFDEPTASLTDREKTSLFENIKQLKANNVGIVYISHKMDEIFEISDRITILRDGKAQGVLNTKDTDVDEVTNLMIGRELDKFFVRAKAKIGKEILRLEKISIDGLLHDISFSIKAGEVVGMYGLVGAGRSEIAESIFGIRKVDSGSFYWKGEPISIEKAQKAIQLGISLVPENRKEQGLMLGLSGRENMSLPILERISQMSVVDSRKEIELFTTSREQLSISTFGPSQLVQTLSGGNQQKIVIGKWLAAKPKLLILDEPTRGIDVGSKAEIHKLIANLAEDGLAVLVISSEMPEVLGVSNRIITLSEGEIVGEFKGEEMTEENLIQAVSKQREKKVYIDRNPKSLFKSIFSGLLN